MKILKNKRNNFTVDLEIEVSLPEFESAMDIAFKKVVKKAKIPGFRPGKATRTIYERYYGRGPIISEAVIEAVNKSYQDAIKELALEVVDQPRNVDISEYAENQPITFSCQVDTKPEVKLGKYKGVKVTKEDNSVTEQALTDAARHLQDKHAQFVEIEGPIAAEQLIRFNLNASIDGEVLADWTRENASIRVGSKQFGDEFDEMIKGLKMSDRKQFTITYPADYADAAVAGKAVAFDIEILEIRDKQLPEFTDEFVIKHSTYTSIEDFRTKTKAELEEAAKEQAEHKLNGALIEAVVADSKVDIPNGMVQREVDYSLYQFDQNLRRSRMNLDYYLKLTQKTIDDVRQDFAESAEKKVRSDLILEAVSQAENIDATDQDCEAEIQKWNLPTEQTLESLKSNPQFNFEQLRSSIVEQKTMAFLKEHAKIS